MMGPWAWGGYGGYGAWGMLLGSAVPLLFLGGLIWLVWALAARGGEHRQALEELELRYARGEITKDEYDKIRKNLRAV